MPHNFKASELRRILNKRLGTDEISNFWNDLGKNIDDLSEMNKNEKVLFILSHLERRESTDKLVDWLKSNRHDIDLSVLDPKILDSNHFSLRRKDIFELIRKKRRRSRKVKNMKIGKIDDLRNRGGLPSELFKAVPIGRSIKYYYSEDAIDWIILLAHLNLELQINLPLIKKIMEELEKQRGVDKDALVFLDNIYRECSKSYEKFRAQLNNYGFNL